MAESRKKSTKDQPAQEPVDTALLGSRASARTRSREDESPPADLDEYEAQEEPVDDGEELPSMEGAAPEPKEQPRRERTPLSPSGIPGAPELTPERLRAFEQGVGHSVEAPDDDGLMERKQRELDMGAMRRARFNPDDKSAVDVEEIARKMGALGSVLRMRVKRMSPEDMPPEESGISDWIPIPHPNPSFEDCEKIIRDRYGGGRYHVTLKSADVESSDEVPRTIELGGDPIPHTIIGRMWFQRRYGVVPQSPSGGGTQTPMQYAPGADPTALSTVKMMLDLLENRERRDQVDKDRKDGREANLATSVIQALQPQKSDTMGLLIQAMPLVLAFLKDGRDERRLEREASERRFEKVLEKMEKSEKPRQPAEILEAMQAVISIVKTRAESEMKMAMDQQGKVFDHMLKTMRDGGREEDASILGALAHAIKERGGDMLAGMGPWIQQMMSGTSAAQIAQQQGIDPRLAAAKGLRLLPPTANPTAPLPTRRTVQAPPAPAPAAGEVQPVAATATTAPAEEAAPAPPAEGGGGPQDPAEFAAMMATDAMQRFLYYLNVFLVSQPDPDAAWALVMDGQAVETLFGVTPILFRQRVASEKFTSISAWVEGAQNEEIVKLAAQADTRCQGDPACARWLVAFLDTGPWVEDDGDGEGDDDPDEGM